MKQKCIYGLSRLYKFPGIHFENKLLIKTSIQITTEIKFHKYKLTLKFYCVFTAVNRIRVL